VKVERINTYILGYDYDRPWGSARVWFQKATQFVVEVITDDGIVGWGTTSSPPVVSRAAIESVLAPLIIGQDPFQSEVLWTEMYHRVKDQGTKGVMIGAISALDTALWDIKGKALGQSVSALLGGRLRERVPAYATGFYFTQDEDQLRVIADEAVRFKEQGFTAMKVKLGAGVDEDVRRVRRVRDTVGDDIVLMTDASRAYSLNNAVKLGRQLEEFNVAWFEEPISPEDLDGYAELCRTLDLPIAGGEAEFTKFGFRDIIAKRALDIIQPEVGRCGGITEAKKIAAIAEAFSMPNQPHNSFSPIETAASLQMLAIVPDSPTSRNTPPPYLEIINVQNPIRDNLLTAPFQLDNGWVTISDKPGLGIEIDRSALRHFLVG
jgi:D-galactarolactone cycloisomerase